MYSFSNLPVGLVRIRIVVPAGSIQTTPNPADINLAFGQTVTNVNFGVFQLISVSGVKFNDFNGDGIQNNGEAGVGGVTIVLTNVGVGLAAAHGHDAMPTAHSRSPMSAPARIASPK